MFCKNFYRNILSVATLICISFVACTPINVYEKTVPIPSQLWYYNNTPSFSFNITDTLASYNVYIVLRHTDAYEYNNIWLRLGIKTPTNFQNQNLNLTLGSDAKGWEGQGMDDIFEVRKNITRGPVPFKISGIYTFTIAQIMRENPLKHVLNVGVRVEKIQ